MRRKKKGPFLKIAWKWLWFILKSKIKIDDVCNKIRMIAINKVGTILYFIWLDDGFLLSWYLQMVDKC